MPPRPPGLPPDLRLSRPSTPATSPAVGNQSSNPNRRTPQRPSTPSRASLSREESGGFLRVLQLSASIFLFHGFAAVCTEAVYRIPGMIYGWVYVLLEFFAYPSLALVEVMLTYPPKRRRLLLIRFKMAMRECFKGFWRGMVGGGGSNKMKSKSSTKRKTNNRKEDHQQDPTSDKNNQRTSTPALSGNNFYFNASIAALAGISQTLSHGLSSATLVYVNITYATLLKASKVHLFFLVHLILHPSDGLPRVGELVGASILFCGLVLFGWGEQGGLGRFDNIGEVDGYVDARMSGGSIFSLAVLLMVLGNALSSVTRDFQQTVMQQTGYRDLEGTDGEEGGEAVTANGHPEQGFDHIAGTEHGQQQQSNNEKDEDEENDQLNPDEALDMLVKLLVFVQYTFAFIIVFIYVVMTGELAEFFRAMIWEAEEPVTVTSALQSSGIFGIMEAFPPYVALVTYMLADNVLTYVGLKAIFLLQREFDASVATAVCTCRKAITFFLSFLFFPKPLSWLHGVGLGCVMCGGGVFYHFGERRRREGVGKNGEGGVERTVGVDMSLFSKGGVVGGVGSGTRTSPGVSPSGMVPSSGFSVSGGVPPAGVRRRIGAEGT